VIVLEIAAWVFLTAMFGVAAGVLFQAVVKIWEHTRTPQVLSYRGREVVRSGPSLSRCGEVILGEWYADDLITPTELELLAEYVIWKGKTLPQTAERARAVLWEDFEDGPEWTTAEWARVVLWEDFEEDLPAGYFDGRVSAERPENATGWIECWRPGRKSIWIRKGVDR
jgi:hypothetical protein